ncbi:uncharacterized protein LAESUDRAFT_723489 [Laetiporus sulphureus 93-53]|uniref:Uncharacterized protein n=1 Tax=Laetiporus sulphureus 93-53 TaxID=1314785 RepID=A0A165F8V5_9APHY|nr:uncharacterized protein LAESUDRAFT_723489 [Laetiporus sulphureus 93-53]KZT08608.1 hypothetical protein LAESUDRAFT_723489 [Laetiporus sulphureus 93-53]
MDGSNNLNRRGRCSIPRTNMMLSAPGTRKRVNPDSLAARLGPELVKELEALLEPGMTEMPPFSVRQAIQKRYNIDRRHVYDWFHSKGLRVTKDRSLEDESRTSSLEPQVTNHSVYDDF